MGWPKGKKREKKEEIETASVNDPVDGSVDLGIEDIRNISVTSRKRVSLSKPEFDPFKKYKTDPKMYYRALNNRPLNITKREAEGYKLIPEAKFGDLILGCMPKEDRKEREAYVDEKTKNQTTAAVEQFKEEASRGGVETYEEK